MPFGLQPIHLVVIVLVALVVFGPKRLPQLGRWLGRTFSEFKRGARDMADGFKEETVRRNTAGPETGTTGTDRMTTGPDTGTTGTDRVTTGPDTAAPGTGSSADGPVTDGPRSARPVDRTPAEKERASPYPEAGAGPFCARCGAANPADARYCTKCGNRLTV
ncbi:MAG: twin-arginine translocase TatA/TatE family subunit [Spirochaetia bacterium]